MLFELLGGDEQMREFLSELRRLRGVRHVYESVVGPDRALLLVVMDRPLTCRASVDAPMICLRCPLSSHQERSSWRILVRRTEDLRNVVGKLERLGVTTTVEEISDLSQRDDLTGRQKTILTTAIAMGYFDFPRKVSLTALSRSVGVKPSTLSEILRSAERKIMEGVIEGSQMKLTSSAASADPFASQALETPTPSEAEAEPGHVAQVGHPQNGRCARDHQ